jgi:hypothetical protein
LTADAVVGLCRRATIDIDDERARERAAKVGDVV